MKQYLKEIYIKVDVNEELPVINEYYHIIRNDNEIEIDSLTEDNSCFLNINTTHWLKPTTQYVLTESELKQIIENAFDTSKESNLAKQQYIENLFK